MFQGGQGAQCIDASCKAVELAGTKTTHQGGIAMAVFQRGDQHAFVGECFQADINIVSQQIHAQIGGAAVDGAGSAGKVPQADVPFEFFPFC